jgi:hypothetical protein
MTHATKPLNSLKNGNMRNHMQELSDNLVQIWYIRTQIKVLNDELDLLLAQQHEIISTAMIKEDYERNVGQNSGKDT